MTAGPTVEVDGHGLTLADLATVARDPGVTVRPSPAAMARVAQGWRQIEAIVARYSAAYPAFISGASVEVPVQDYGVTTGFGEFKDIPVPPEALQTAQRNLLLSHMVGVGDNTDPDDLRNYYPADVVRATLLIRLNAFLKGHSGLRPELVDTVVAMLNRGIVPLVPLRGSVGASGDLCPLAHLFGVLVGAGRYQLVTDPAGSASAAPPRLRPAAELAADLGMAPAAPTYKEGLALINGATVSAALLALAAHDAARLAEVADTAAALSLEAVCGCARAFDERVHAARGMTGQMTSAARARALVSGSRLIDRAGAVQDVYSLRCAPAVHGASRDAIAYARDIAEREINAATDNPLFFPAVEGQADDRPPFDAGFAANWPADYRGEERASYSAGNFHGQPLALAADFLAIALAELADISERRSQLLLDAHFSRGLPANLIPYRGTQSGLMLLQYSAASLVSENKVLAHPASVDSIPTAANAEDHVSMATTAGRKLRAVLANVEATLAIELLVAAQALEWRAALVLGDCQIVHLTHDRLAATPAGDRAELLAAQDEEAAVFRRFASPAGRAEVASLLGQGSAAAYRAIRAVVDPVVVDRPLDGDILQLRRAIAEGRVGVDAA